MADTKVIITVRLTSGTVDTHHFDIENVQGLITLMTFYGEQLNKVFQLRSSHAFVVHEPMTIYNRDHVLSVRFDFIGVDEYESMTSDIIPDQMGFQKPTVDSKR